jgi:N6-adenosine-specific RNA methylase IME4
MNFDGLKRAHYGAILADPPWDFACWVKTNWSGSKLPNGGKNYGSARGPTYKTLKENEIAILPVKQLAAPNSVLFLWTCWPILPQALRVIKAWGFKYKTCGFCWTKARAQQLEMFQDHIEPRMGLGYWTRANSEICLLATRGSPKRRSTNVKQAIIEPLREHSRKPDCVHERIERLVAGPYCELFARQRRPGWECWGDELNRFAPITPDSRQESWADMWARPFDWSKETAR